MTARSRGRRRITLLLAATAATVVALAVGSPAYAGTLPPNCGTANTPSCGVPK